MTEEEDFRLKISGMTGPQRREGKCLTTTSLRKQDLAETANYFSPAWLETPRGNSKLLISSLISGKTSSTLGKSPCR